MNELVKSAIALSGEFLPVFPCHPKTKVAAIKDWPNIGVQSREQIEAWWTVQPEYNVAVAVPDDLVVIDIEAGKQRDVEQIIGHKFPPTRWTRTPGKGGGGVHLWYRKPTSVQVKNRVRILPDVDVRSRGGYVMAPPSVHPDTGTTYEWGDRLPIADAPDWLLEILINARDHDAEHEPMMSVVQMLSGIPKGMQRWVMFRHACSRRSKNYDPEEVKAFLWEVVNRSDQDKSRPWKREDIDYLVDDVWKRYDALPQRQDPQPGRPWTPGELANHTFATNRWIAKPILKRGVTVVSSHAKRGKSMMIATMVKSVALGERVWDTFESQKTGVLMLDLEQDEAEAAERWKHIMGDHQLDNVKVFFTWPTMDKGGLDHIREYLRRNADCGMVVIDTWSMFATGKPSERTANMNMYYQEYDVLGTLKSLANEFSVALIIVHHFSVGGERPSGTAAMEGSPDGDWRLKREERSNVAILDVKGKNQPETRINFLVDLRKYEWTVTSVE